MFLRSTVASLLVFVFMPTIAMAGGTERLRISAPDIDTRVTSLNSRIQSINSLYLRGQRDTALLLAEELYAQYPDYVSVQTTYLRLLTALGRRDEAEKIRRKLADRGVPVKSPQPPQKNWSASAQFKYGNTINARSNSVHDTINYSWVNLGPDVANIVSLFNIPANDAPPNAIDPSQDEDRNELFQDIILSGNYNFAVPLDNTGLTVGGSLYMRNYDSLDDDNDGSGDNDVRATSVNTLLTHMRGERLYQIKADISHLELREDSFSTSYSLSIKTDAKTGKWLSLFEPVKPEKLSMTLQTKQNHNLAHSSIVNNTSRSGNSYRGEVAGQYTFKAPVELKAYAEKFHQKDPSGNFNELGLSANLAVPVNPFTVTAQLGFSIKQYETAPAVGASDALWGLHRRRDEINKLNVSVIRGLGFLGLENINLIVDAAWKRQRSNKKLFDIDSGEVSLSLVRNW